MDRQLARSLPGVNEIRSVTSIEQGKDLVAGDDTAAPPAIQRNDGYVHEGGDPHWELVIGNKQVFVSPRLCGGDALRRLP